MKTELQLLLTSSYKNQMVAFIKSHPEKIEDLIQLAISDNPPYAWRAAWLLWSCMQENDERIQPYIQKIIDVLPSKSDNHQRELIKILLQMDLNEEFEGVLFQNCMYIWSGISKKPSVRFNAFKMMLKITQKHPDLCNEMILLVQEPFLDSLSAAAKKSILKMMNSNINITKSNF